MKFTSTLIAAVFASSAAAQVNIDDTINRAIAQALDPLIGGGDATNTTADDVDVGVFPAAGGVEVTNNVFVNITNPYAYVTETVTAYVTYCPSFSTYSNGSKTYTATSSIWSTVTNCPSLCTISNAVGAAPTVKPFNGTVPKPGVAAPYSNSTVAAAPSKGPSGTISIGAAESVVTVTAAASKTSPAAGGSTSPAAFQGAGVQVSASMTALAGIVGFVIYAL